MEGVSQLAHWILSAVIQECPLCGSGMLFALAIDLFLPCRKATGQDKDLAWVRVCADDKRTILKNINVLRLFEPIFQTAA